MKIATSMLLATVLPIGLLLKVCTSPEAAQLPPITDTLIRGTNFNGKGGIDIEGYRWTSQSDAKGNGLLLRDAENLTTNLTPKPSANENLQAMLNSSIAQTGTLKIDQTMYGAQYDMYFWFMENQRGPQRSMSIEIEGQQVEEAMGNSVSYTHLTLPTTSRV